MRTLGLAACALLVACVWDTDTLRDELQRHPGEFDLVSGQFEHHGKVYYEQRLKRLEAELPAHPDDVVRRNDRAVALLKLGRYAESKEEFARIEALSPGLYETLSNLGVLHKKMGDFDASAKFLERALALKPEGHMGVGDYYVKMVKYLGESAKAPPERSFLGYSYEEYSPLFGPSDRGFQDHEETIARRMPKLIEADASFADGMLVLGDVFSGRQDLNLALWAYVRAGQLGHPNPGVLRKRIDEIFEHWRGASKSGNRGLEVEERESTLQAIQGDLAKAAQWRAKFEEVEGEMVAGGREVDFNAVNSEMARRGIARFQPPDRGAIRTWRAGVRQWQSWAIPAVAILGIAVLVAKYLRDRRRAAAA